MTEIPGTAAKHAIITPECRRYRGDEAAAIEATERIGDELFKCLEGWPIDGAKFHVVLTIERLPSGDT